MKRFQIPYEVFLLFLMSSYAVLVFADAKQRAALPAGLIMDVDVTLTIGFILEYIVRFYRAEKKLNFVLRNWFDLVAVVPVNPHMVLARFLRLLRLARILKASPFVRACMQIKSIQRMFMLLILVILWSSAAIYFLEHGINPTIKSYGDALWWACVTVSTVGYGDVYPVTAAGRVIAALLMISSIGFLGTFATELATHWKQFVQGERNQTTEQQRRSQIKMWIDEMETVDDRVFLQISRILHTNDERKAGPATLVDRHTTQET